MYRISIGKVSHKQMKLLICLRRPYTAKLFLHRSIFPEAGMTAVWLPLPGYITLNFFTTHPLDFP